MGLVGPIFGYEGLAGANLFRIGGQGEYYLRRITLSLRAGYKGGDDNASGTLRIPKGAFLAGRIAFYPTENLMLRAGLGMDPVLGGDHQLKVTGRIEWQVNTHRLPGWTLTVSGNAGSIERYAVRFGIRYYFRFSGDRSKPLIRRHREDDPAPVPTGGGFTSGPATGGGTSPNGGGESDGECDEGEVFEDGFCIRPD